MSRKVVLGDTVIGKFLSLFNIPVKSVVLRYSMVSCITTEFRENQLIAKAIGENLKCLLKTYKRIPFQQLTACSLDHSSKLSRRTSSKTFIQNSKVSGTKKCVQVLIFTSKNSPTSISYFKNDPGGYTSVNKAKGKGNKTFSSRIFLVFRVLNRLDL